MQAIWYFSNLHGNDHNDGLTPATALKTTAEYTKRVGTMQILKPGQIVDLYFLDDMVATDRFSPNVTITDPTCHFYIHGTATPEAAGVLTSFTPRTGNTPQTIVATGLTDTLLGKIIHFTDVDGWTYLWKNNGAGGYEINDVLEYPGPTKIDITNTPPGNNAPFTVYSNSKMYFGAVTFVTAYVLESTVWPPVFKIEDIFSPDVVLFNGSGTFWQPAQINRCVFTDVNAIGANSTYFTLCNFNCTVANSTLASTIEVDIQFSGCVFQGTGIYKLSNALIGQRRYDSESVFGDLHLLGYHEHNGRIRRTLCTLAHPGRMLRIEPYVRHNLGRHANQHGWDRPRARRAVHLRADRSRRQLDLRGIRYGKTGSAGRERGTDGLLATTRKLRWRLAAEPLPSGHTRRHRRSPIQRKRSRLHVRMRCTEFRSSDLSLLRCDSRADRSRGLPAKCRHPLWCHW